MKHHRLSMGYLLLAGILVFFTINETAWAGQNQSGMLASTTIYVPEKHSRPYFIKRLRPHRPSPVKIISINDTQIAEVKVISPYEMVIDGLKMGSTMCIVWYEDGTKDFLEIRVVQPDWPSLEVEVIRGLNSSASNSLYNAR